MCKIVFFFTVKSTSSQSILKKKMLWSTCSIFCESTKVNSFFPVNYSGKMMLWSTCPIFFCELTTLQQFSFSSFNSGKNDDMKHSWLYVFTLICLLKLTQKYNSASFIFLHQFWKKWYYKELARFFMCLLYYHDFHFPPSILEKMMIWNTRGYLLSIFHHFKQFETLHVLFLIFQYLIHFEVLCILFFISPHT